jgi:hypothetical protein
MAFLIVGTLAVIYFIRAAMDPAATVNVDRVETSDPGIKFRAALNTALIPIFGLIFVFLPRRFFERLHAHNLDVAQRMGLRLKK